MKKILLLIIPLCLILLLAGCGKKVCTAQVCVEGECMDIEVPCEDSTDPATDPDMSPEPTDNIPIDTSSPLPTNDPNNTNEPIVTPSPKPTNNTSDVPNEVTDPGIDYSKYLDVEQAAMNAFQAIVDGDYNSLLSMCYITDNKFVSVDDMITFFKISDFGSIKGKNITITNAEAKNQGYNRTVIITYNIDGGEPITLDMQMMLYNDVWKYVNESFIMNDWYFKTTKGTVVTLDEIVLTPTGGSSSIDSYAINVISRVEHKLTYSYNGENTVKYIVPGKDTADMFYE